MKRVYERSGNWLFRAVRPLLWATPAMNGPRVRVLVRQGDAVLLARSWFGRQRWTLPGGGVEQGETPEEAAVRELHEELGLVINATGLISLTTVTIPDAPWPQVLYYYNIPAGDRPQLIMRKGEILEAGWFTPDELPAGRNPIVDIALGHDTARKHR